jgi:prevent-host-death family protein
MTTKKQSPGKRVSLLLAQKRELGATEFKATCLDVMDEVERLGIEVTITKHRRPIAKLVPVNRKRRGFVGSMAGSVTWMGDIISPIDVEWEANAPDTP